MPTVVSTSASGLRDAMPIREEVELSITGRDHTEQPISDVILFLDWESAIHRLQLESQTGYVSTATLVWRRA